MPTRSESRLETSWLLPLGCSRHGAALAVKAAGNASWAWRIEESDA
jgi:hypothetical protein